MSDKLLSICIPTYNRAETLGRSLEALFANPEFDANKVEVMVADNASADNTSEVVARFPQVRYIRHKENIGADANFTFLLDHASGRYLRLMNDYCTFRPGGLALMLREIEAADEARENLWFGTAMTSIPAGITVTHGVDEFIRRVSYWSTWIGNFGVWRKDWADMEDKNRYVKYQLNQVDWSLRIAGNGRPTRIIVADLTVSEDLKQRGSYNYFDIFLVKYREILKAHDIGFWANEVDKYKLLRYNVLPRIYGDNDYSLDMSGGRKIVLQQYWYEPYYWPGVLIFKTLYKPLKRLFRR